ncbi:MAG: hypothetical protein FJ248_03725 [Nitrospira sp.]|nr:hypothetical protein [Nitrospira sp.]
MMSKKLGWLRQALNMALVAVVAGFTAPAWAAFELPEGEKITNLPAIPRAIPQKEGYELYDPKIGKNFDIKNFWLRADLRVRPEMRQNTCFGANNAAAGACNVVNHNGAAGKANDFYVQQWVRLGIGYDLSPDVNFYMEIIDAAVWGATGGGNEVGAGLSSLNHGGSNDASGGTANRLGVRAAYVLVRNLGGIQGLSMKAGRQYVIFGNHSLFGHFDWANTGFSHDGLMFSYETKAVTSYLGWFREAESDIRSGAPVGSLAANVVTNTTTGRDGQADADLFIFYNQIKSVPGFLIEPYYVLYVNNQQSEVNRAQGLGTAKHSNQIRHMIGNRIEMRKGNWDFTNETAYQFGRMGDSGQPQLIAGEAQKKNLTINAWAMRNWFGYTAYNNPMKPRLAFNLDYASGDSKSNCSLNAGYGRCSTANTFENFYPTNHIHMGYMDIQAWKNMMSPSINFQFRPTKDDHFEIWATSLNLADRQDNWYRGGQGVYVYSKVGNTKKHIGDEIDFSWTRMFAEGKVAFQLNYSTMFSGGYIEHNLGQSQNQHWGYAQIWMNF